MLLSMGSGGWNLTLGLVAFAAGASGQFALPGTSSPMPLMVAGGAIALLGAFSFGARAERKPSADHAQTGPPLKKALPARRRATCLRCRSSSTSVVFFSASMNATRSWAARRS